MTKKDTYISMRNAGMTREEVREEMGMSANLEQKYNSLYYRDVERDNRKAVESLPDGTRIDGTPKPTPAEAERKIAETLGLVEYAPEAHTAPEPETPATHGTDTLTIHGDYCDYVIRIEVRPTVWNVATGGLAELGAKLSGEMAAVAQQLREAIL